ncbi:neural-cadherin-like [Arapaima gigas]
MSVHAEGRKQPRANGTEGRVSQLCAERAPHPPVFPLKLLGAALALGGEGQCCPCRTAETVPAPAATDRALRQAPGNLIQLFSCERGGSSHSGFRGCPRIAWVCGASGRGDEWYLCRLALTVPSASDLQWAMFPHPYLAAVPPDVGPTSVVYRLSIRRSDSTPGTPHFLLVEGKAFGGGGGTHTLRI